ncbi:MAG: ATP-binding protein [bacterium]|nr:ATP-binding protein [bacterium]MDT8365627.1 ATP-binding protein [bacterium]
MFRSLWAKFFILLLVVSLIGLSAALYMRQMMLGDFKAYLDGERLDRVYLVMANLEGSHERNNGWDRRELSRSAIQALMLGMEVKVQDVRGSIVMDTQQALEELPPFMARRVLSRIEGEPLTGTGEFFRYPLFLGGKRVGTLDVKILARDRGLLFAQRSTRFMIISFLMMGGIAIFASLFVSRRLTLPLKRLVEQTRAIRRGELGSRADIASNDEIGKLSHAFNEMADDLELQESLRRKLIANVAHELRTPLAAMRGELEGMIDGVLAADKDQMRSLHEETGRLGTILDGIDDLTQAQASSLTLEKRDVELKTFLGNIRDRFGARAEEGGVKVGLVVEDGALVWADPDRLSQIVINLLSNAVKATSAGGTVTLKAGTDGDMSFIEVSDSGKGISDEELPHIFERFFRGTGGGLGLGLTIVRELVDAHGGEISVHSRVGEGTSVRVTLSGRK